MEQIEDETVSDAVTKIRDMCKRRGDAGVKDLGRIFRIYDKNHDRNMTFDEFSRGLDMFGCPLAQDEMVKAFKYFDRDRSGSVDCGEFFRVIRPPMSGARKSLVIKAFEKVDMDDSGVITVKDLEKLYNVTKSPKYLSGEMTAKQVFAVFLNSFQSDGNAEVTKQEWMDYYAGVSAHIDKDVYFDYMMRQAWKM